MKKYVIDIPDDLLDANIKIIAFHMGLPVEEYILGLLGREAQREDQRIRETWIHSPPRDAGFE